MFLFTGDDLVKDYFLPSFFNLLLECSVTMIKVLDASGPPGLPSLLGGASEMMLTTGISALSFSPDGEVNSSL